MSDKEKIELLRKALKATMALDLPHGEGRVMLASCGFDYSDRFNYPATRFVLWLQLKAIKETD